MAFPPSRRRLAAALILTTGAAVLSGGLLASRHLLFSGSGHTIPAGSEAPPGETPDTASPAEDSPAPTGKATATVAARSTPATAQVATPVKTDVPSSFTRPVVAGASPTSPNPDQSTGNPAPDDDTTNGRAPDAAAAAADLLSSGVDLSDPAQRAAVVAKMRANEDGEKSAAVAKAAQLGLQVRIQRRDGSVMELMRFDGDRPVYAETRNANAAISSGANQLYAAPYSVTGSGFTAGIWDGGSVRATHQEFGGRVNLKETDTADDHATHVAGTIGAAGVVAKAKGMAPGVTIDSYEWNNDKSEMTSRGASYPGEPGTIYVSNHSYGYSSGWTYTGLSSPMWTWYGTGTTATGTETEFGVYDSYSRETDALAAALPYYLVMWAAGNDRSDDPETGDPVSLSTSTRTAVSYNPASHPKGDGRIRTATISSPTTRWRRISSRWAR